VDHVRNCLTNAPEGDHEGEGREEMGKVLLDLTTASTPTVFRKKFLVFPSLTG